MPKICWQEKSSSKVNIEVYIIVLACASPIRQEFVLSFNLYRLGA